MDATTSALLEQLVKNLEPLNVLRKSFLFSSEFWTMISSLVALFSSGIALFVAGGGGRYVKGMLKNTPNLEIIGFRPYKQATDYWRLAIKNVGKETAKKVQVDVTNIFENQQDRENFLAVPLRWTHLRCEDNCVSRDILSQQTVYIDVLEHKPREDRVEIITPGSGGVDDYKVLTQGRSKLKLTFYEESGISFTKFWTVDLKEQSGLELRMETLSTS